MKAQAQLSDWSSQILMRRKKNFAKKYVSDVNLNLCKKKFDKIFKTCLSAI